MYLYKRDNIDVFSKNTINIKFRIVIIFLKEVGDWGRKVYRVVFKLMELLR